VRDLWFSWSFENRTVSCLGIVFHQPGPHQPATVASAAAFEDFANAAWRFTLAAVYGIYTLLVGTIYGWGRCLAALRAINLRRALAYIVVTLPVIILAGYLLEALHLYAGDPSPQVKRPASVSIATATLLLAALGPLVEELFVRFTIYQGLRSKFPFWVAAMIASIIFGLAHFAYPDHRKIIIACAVSLLWCWLYERTGSLLVPACTHIGNDVFFVLLRLQDQQI
jgi:membrane protease YdiL (CAAX protease family)